MLLAIIPISTYAADSSILESFTKKPMKGHAETTTHSDFLSIRVAQSKISDGSVPQCGSAPTGDFCYRQLWITGLGKASDVLQGTTDCPQGYEPLIRFGDQFTYKQGGVTQDAVFYRKTYTLPTSYSNGENLKSSGYVCNKIVVEKSPWTKLNNKCKLTASDRHNVTSYCWPHNWKIGGNYQPGEAMMDEWLGRSNYTNQDESTWFWWDRNLPSGDTMSNGKTLKEIYNSAIPSNLSYMKNPSSIPARIYGYIEKDKAYWKGCTWATGKQKTRFWTDCANRFSETRSRFRVRATVLMFTHCSLEEGFGAAGDTRRTQGNKYTPNTVICGKVKHGWKPAD